MQSFKDFLIAESIIDFKLDHRDPLVFVNQPGEKYPQINPAIISQIMQEVPAFSRFGNIAKVNIVGSILTYRWTDTSDIDVTIFINAPSPDDTGGMLVKDLCVKMNGRPAPGTLHPINYYVAFSDTYNESNFENIYDVYSNKWVKTSEGIDDLDINKFMDDFGRKVAKLDIGLGILRRNLIDIRKLKKFSKKDLKNGATMCRARLRNITSVISGMEDMKAEIKKARQDAFSKPLTPKELKTLKTKNALPENVIYKLFEYYWYWELLEDLKNAVGEDEKVETPEEVKKVEKAVNKFNDKMKDKI